MPPRWKQKLVELPELPRTDAERRRELEKRNAYLQHFPWIVKGLPPRTRCEGTVAPGERHESRCVADAGWTYTDESGMPWVFCTTHLTGEAMRDERERIDAHLARTPFEES